MSLVRELRELWRADLYRYGGRADLAAFFKHWLLSPGYTFSFYLRLCSVLQRRRGQLWLLPFYLVARLLLRHYSYKFGIFIFPETVIGPGLYIGHCGDIHLNREARIGKNCNISQGVTLGQANRGKNKGTPVLGDGIYIGPGAKIVGAVQIGNDVAIGANCVVTSNLPDHAVAVGIPARVISHDGAQGYVEYTDYTLPTGPQSQQRTHVKAIREQ